MIQPTSSAAGVESDLRRELSERIERGELELPVLSQAATRVASMCIGGASDARALADTLNRDPALAGHVLRVSNSSAYAPAEPIVSLQQAVSRLGSATLGQITFAIAVGARVFHVPGHEAWVAEMWRHATLSAGWAREIARVRRRNVESSFLSGLLHDVGRPVLLQAALDLLAKSGCVAKREELEPLLDELHGRAGAHLARAWKMPSWIAATMLHHHAPQAANLHADEVHTTAFADELVAWTLGESDDLRAAIERMHGLPGAAILCLYEDELVTLLERRDKVIEFAGALQ